MADYYVWSGATGAATGADWTNAYLKLDTAMSGKAAGSNFYVAHDHAQTQASLLTLTSPGTAANPCKVLCVNRLGSVPPVAADLRTTGSIAVTGAFDLNMQGHYSEVNGIVFSLGSGSSQSRMFMCSTTGAANQAMRFLNCTFKLLTTSAGGRFYPTDLAGAINIFDNCSFQFGAVGQSIGLGQGNGAIFRNCPNFLLGSTFPSILFITNNNVSSTFMEGCDLSPFPAANTLMQGTAQSNAAGGNRLVLKDCKLRASQVLIAPGATLNPSNALDLIRCDSGDVNYRNERYFNTGTITTETTVVRTGGATDGTTAISWKFVTSALCRNEWPLEGFPITIWNETVGSAITVTLQGIWGTGSVPNNDDIFMEVEYLGTSGVPLGSFISTNKATTLSANAPLTAGSGTWGGSTTKFQLSAVFTPQEKGPLTIYVKAAKASSTFYIDPEPAIT